MTEMKKPKRIKIDYVKSDPVKIPVKIVSEKLTDEDMRRIEELLRKGE